MLKSGNRGTGYSQEVASTVSLSFNIFEKFYYFICVFIFPMNQVYKPPDCPMIALAFALLNSMELALYKCFDQIRFRLDYAGTLHETALNTLRN